MWGTLSAGVVAFVVSGGPLHLGDGQGQFRHETVLMYHVNPYSYGPDPINMDTGMCVGWHDAEYIHGRNPRAPAHRSKMDAILCSIQVMRPATCSLK